MQQKKERGEYITRGYLLVKNTLKNARGVPLSADAIFALLKAEGETVGRTTVYRQLERLCEEGNARRTQIDGTSLFCFSDSVCEEHYHLLCTRCGKLDHLSCARLEELVSHIGQDHGFRVDPSLTTLYGLCAFCARQSKHKEHHHAHTHA